MFLNIIRILSISILFLHSSSLSAQEHIKNSIVKVYAVTSNYNYDNPWQMSGQSNSTGSGSIISGNRILTNAHVVSNHTFIQVKKAGEPDRYTARLESISHDSDLAILKVDNPDFFKGSKPIDIGELPHVRDRVVVYGFPTGGDELSITEGVVSRIEQRNYAHSNANLLTCQIDAAINPGNSGGPVIKDDRIVGVAFQTSSMGENIGYMVPAPVIMHFLKDTAKNGHGGFPELGIRTQHMENPDQRLKFNMTGDHNGVLVTGILIDSPVRDIIKIDDVILSIENVNVANDGSVEIRKGERTSMNYVIQQKYINDKISITVLRNGREQNITAKLTVPMNSTRLVPFEKYDIPPTYFISGGLLFQPLTKNYMHEWGGQWFLTAPSKLMNFYINGIRSENRKEVVLLSKVLADEINQGYHDMSNLVIERVNGQNISEMKDLVKAFESNKGLFHIIEDDAGQKIIISRDKADRFSKRILDRYKIAEDRSDDLK
jgi:S1-C subfamily serine protease